MACPVDLALSLLNLNVMGSIPSWATRDCLQQFYFIGSIPIKTAKTGFYANGSKNLQSVL